MAKRKEYNISVKANVTANLPPEEIKKLERQIKKIRGQVNMEGIDYSKVKALREYNNELREYNRQTERAKRNQGLTLGDYFAEARRKKQRELREEFESNRPVLPQRQNVSLSHAELKRAMLSDVELETRLQHSAAVPIDSHTFIRNRGDVAYRAYLTRADPSTGRPGGKIVVVPFEHGPALFNELSKMNVDMNSVNAITEVIRNLQKEPSNPYTRAILPPLLDLRRHGIFDDSVFSSQLVKRENRQGTQTFNRVMEAYIRELTRAGYPVQPSRLTGGLTHDYRSFQGSREWLKYLLQTGHAEQLLFDVQLPIQSLLAKPTTQFAYHMLNSGVKPYIATEKAYQFAEQRGYNKIPGWESIRFDPEYYYDPINYKTVEPRPVSKPGRRIAIIPSDDIYNPSYIPLTTGLRRNIAGFDPSMFNPEIASALNQAIYPRGGDVPAWDHMTNRYMRDFDYHKYIAYSSELENLVRSGPITRSQLARNLEKQLFSGNIFSNTIGGLNRDMMYRADWFTDKRLLTTVPTYIDALSAMSGIVETLSKHFANAKEHGLFEYSSILSPNMNKYFGLSSGDMLNMIDMFTVLSRRGVPSLHDAKNPLLGPGIFQHPANERELIALQSMLGDLPLYDLRQELYRIATIPDRNATLANLDIDERALDMNALANVLKEIQDEEAAKKRPAAEHIRGFRRGGSSSSNYFARLRREDPDNPDRGDPDAGRANRAAKKMGKPAAIPWSRTLIPTFQALIGGGFSHKWRPEMFTEEQLALLSSDIIEKANAEIYNEINKNVLAEFQKQLGSKNVPGYLVQRTTASRFNKLFKTKGTGGKYDIMLLQKAFDLAGIPYDDMLSLDPEYKTRGGFKYLGNIIPPSEPEEPIYTDPEEAKLRAELEELNRLRESIPDSDINTRKFIVSRRAEINSELERLQIIDDRAGIGRNYSAELEGHADIIKIPGTDYEVIPREVDPLPSGARPHFLRHESMFDNLMGTRFKNLQNYLKLLKNLKSLLPLAGVSLAAVAAGSMLGMPELGMAPMMFAGLTGKAPENASDKLEAQGKKIYWDIDGTYLYNFLDQKFEEHTKLLGLDNFKLYNRANPLVNPSDIKRVITARPEKYRDATLADLAKAGVFPSELIMRGDDAWDREGSIEYKARKLKELGATHYVDDDIAYNSMLKPLLGNAISTITTTDFYQMAGQLLQRTNNFMHIGKLETSSVIDLLKKTLTSQNGKKLLKAAIPLVLAGALSAATGIAPDLAMMGAMPFAFMGSTKQKPLTQDKLLEKLNNAITRRDVLEKAVQSTSEPIRKKKLQKQLDNILNVIEDTEYKYSNYDEYLKSFDQATPESAGAPSDTPDYSSFLEYTPWKKGDDIYKLYGTLGYDIRGQGFPKEAITFQQTLREELGKLPFFQQHPEELENFKVYTTTDTNFQNYDVSGRAYGTLRVRGKADLRKLGDVSDEEYAETAKQIDQVTKSVIGSTSANDKYAESMLVTAQATKDSSKELNVFARYSEKMGRISWLFTLVSMNALGVFFSMMSVNNMLMQGINMVMTPLMDLDKLMQSYALSQAFASKTGIDMNEIMKESGLTLNDIIDGWETMTGFISNLQFGLGLLGANILGDPDTYEAIQKAVEKIVKWLSNPKTAGKVADVVENLAEVVPQLVDALPAILEFVGILTTPFNPNAKEDDWLGKQSLFSLMLYGQIAAMFAMPILSIISLLFRILQGILWVGGVISGWKAASTLLGGGEGALLGGGGALAGSKIYQKLFGNIPKGGYATGAAAMEAAATEKIGLVPRISAMFTGPGAWMGKAAGPLGVLLALLSMAEPVGGSSLMRTDTLGNVYYGKTEEEIKEKIKAKGGVMWTPESGIPRPTPKYDNYPSGGLTNDSSVPEWARGISNIDPNNASDIYKWVYGTSNINFDQMGNNYVQNITMMKNATDDLAPAIAAFNGNPSFAGFQRESGLDNVTFKQENHFEINVQGSLDEKSTPNLFSGLTSLLAGRWS